MKTLGQNACRRFSGWDMNRVSPKHGSDAFAILTCLVLCWNIKISHHRLSHNTLNVAVKNSFNRLKTAFLLNNINKSSSYLTKTHYTSATNINRLMLFNETVAVYCENHTKHTDTLCGQNAEFQHVKTGGIYGTHGLKMINNFKIYRKWGVLLYSIRKHFAHYCLLTFNWSAYNHTKTIRWWCNWPNLLLTRE
jgi:hypothetical protein